MKAIYRVLGVAACSLAAWSASAQASWFEDEAPPANARPLSAIIKSVEDQGYKTITEVEFEDGKWEIEVHQANGKETEIHVDPVSGRIVPE
ncbi:MAG TPA: PepSY domain-containing protein [Rhizomicrobium sp.]|nr:PepSY domain-containing protein [Rhizomicrobium sp.]